MGVRELGIRCRTTVCAIGRRSALKAVGEVSEICVSCCAHYMGASRRAFLMSVLKDGMLDTMIRLNIYNHSFVERHPGAARREAQRFEVTAAAGGS